ncbi:MAG: hypothetical protein ACPGOY_16685 [Rhodospirillaceae bacterium]
MTADKSEPPLSNGDVPSDQLSEAMRKALIALEGATSWRGYLEDLTSAGLIDQLDASQRQDLSERWQRGRVKALTDRFLVEELLHWSQGLGYQHHQEGFEALSVPILVAEARRRGWFTSDLAGGGVLIGPPDHKPIRLTGV